MTKSEFSKLHKSRQFVLLRDLGSHLANRSYQGFIVSLFDFEGFYVEVWKRVGLDYIEYIEVVKDNLRLEEYLGDFNLDKDLDI
jgi:hypothetical protein